MHLFVFICDCIQNTSVRISSCTSQPHINTLQKFQVTHISLHCAVVSDKLLFCQKSLDCIHNRVRSLHVHIHPQVFAQAERRRVHDVSTVCTPELYTLASMSVVESECMCQTGPVIRHVHEKKRRSGKRWNQLHMWEHSAANSLIGWNSLKALCWCNAPLLLTQ